MSQKTETKITKSILDWLVKVGGDGFHVHGSTLQRAGEPDIDGHYYHPSGVVHIKYEVKIPGEEPTKLQYVRLASYKKAGYFSNWGTSLEQFKEQLRDYINEVHS